MQRFVVLVGIGIAAIAGPPVSAQQAGKPVFVEKGAATFYGSALHGKTTASGEKYDQNKLTAAHPELPLGSKATVTNLETGKKVEVEVNDRGPYADDKAIDLSKAAAKKIGIGTHEGTAPVRIEASRTQVEQAIDRPAETAKVERELKEARKEAAKAGTPQPKVPLKLTPPVDEVAGSK